MKKIFLYVLLTFPIYAQDSVFIKGIDLSFLPQIEDLGGSFYIDDTLADPLQIFSQNGADYVRLRLWHTPEDGYVGLEKTLEFAQRIKDAGFKFLLDFHYSDTWADPGNQEKPEAWEGLSYNELSDSIYAYSFAAIKAFDTLNILPDMVQVGNEITPGFLWPEGRVGGTYDTQQQWTQFTNLLKAAINAIHAASDSSIRIMIHIDRGGDNNASRWFFNNITNYNVPFDVIGLSFYPWWHGTLTSLRQNINDLAIRFNKDIVVVETAYPWTLTWYDNVNNLVGNQSQLHSGYPASVEGQYSFLYDLIQTVKGAPNNRGIGIFYWEPAYISVQPMGSAWENLALFDFQGNALNSMRVFNEIETDTSDAVNVTFRFNTSTNYDTLSPDSFVQLRGEIYNGTDILVSGEELTWENDSEVILENIGGDYWEKTVRVVPGSEIRYKFWTGHSSNTPTYLRSGWEGPITPYDSITGNFRKFVAGTSDTILQVEYYNSLGSSAYQYWKPFETIEDSVAIFFRVNMQGVTSSGRFDPDTNGPVGVRGESNDLNILSWNQSKIILEREDISINEGSFWSGAAYFPKAASGMVQEYKFHIENDLLNGYENSINNRSFIIPEHDSTIHWVYFNNNIVTGIKDESIFIPFYNNLNQNYPNPFNSSTLISYSLKEKTRINISIFNSLGESINTLLNDFQSEGEYTISWNGKNLDGKDLTSGIYFIQMKTPLYNQTIKAILLK